VYYLKVHRDISNDYEIMLKWIYKREYETLWKEEIFEAQKLHKKWLRNYYYFLFIDSAAYVHVCMLMLHIAYVILGTRHTLN